RLLISLYFLWSSSLGNTLEDDITANSAEVLSSEGFSVSLSCKYSVKADNLQWYRQNPGSSPQFLLLITDTQQPSVVHAQPPEPRLTAELNKERTQVHLKIPSATVSDSAVYYCAVRPTVTGNTKTLYKNLWIKDNSVHHPPEGVSI
uniref:Ig-like domain-containing protein n=1 Tax=Gasterosteus aculeatus aculeatus TaxID=481459 RepID=A0AAQ4S8D9_GASAC